MNAAIGHLTESQWNQEFPGYFKTISQLCSHIYVSDYNWLKRFRLFRDIPFLKDPLLDRNLTNDSRPFDNVADYVSKRETLDRMLVLLIDELTEVDMGKTISFTNPRGEKVSKNVGGSILHIFNHQTHHRGMISAYLDLMKIDNDFSSLLPLVEAA